MCEAKEMKIICTHKVVRIESVPYMMMKFFFQSFSKNTPINKNIVILLFFDNVKMHADLEGTRTEDRFDQKFKMVDMVCFTQLILVFLIL
jgi:hypothetical protein